MDDICGKVLCTGCIHNQVCNKKEDFLRIIESLDSVSICLGDGSTADIRHIKWVDLGKLRCEYYIHDDGIRSRAEEL